MRLGVFPEGDEQLVDRQAGVVAVTDGEVGLLGQPLLDEPVVFGEGLRGAVASEVMLPAVKDDQH